MQPTTPIGSRTTSEVPTVSEYSNDSATAAACLKELIGSPTWTSWLSILVMPVSLEITVAISSMRPASASPIRLMYFARSSRGRPDHDSKAAHAARVASATSAAVPAGMVAMTCSVTESKTEMVSALEGLTHWPLM